MAPKKGATTTSYNLAGGKSDDPLPQQIKFNPSTMALPDHGGTDTSGTFFPVWINQPNSYRWDNIQKFAAYYGFSTKAEAVDILYDGVTREILLCYEKLSDDNFGIIHSRKGANWKPNQTASIDLWIVLRKLDAEWIKTVPKDPKEYPLTFDHKASKNHCPQNWEDFEDDKEKHSYWLNVIGLLSAFLQANPAIRKLWSPVKYTMAGLNSENWWRAWLYLKVFKSTIERVKRNATWEPHCNIWKDVAMLSENTPSAPKVAAIDMSMMEEAELKSKKQTFPLFAKEPWLLNKQVGFEPGDLLPTSDSSYIIIPDSKTRAPMEPHERNELLYSLTTSTKIISIGTSDAPQDRLLNKHAKKIEMMQSGIQSRIEASAREEEMIKAAKVTNYPVDTSSGKHASSARDQESEESEESEEEDDDEYEDDGDGEIGTDKEQELDSNDLDSEVDAATTNQRIVGLLDANFPTQTPDYAWVCRKYLDIDPVSPKADSTSDANPLTPHQVLGIAWLLMHEDGAVKMRILADECGLGKTASALHVVEFGVRRQIRQQLLKYRATLIIVPANVIFNWVDEAKKWLPGLKISTLYGQKVPGSRNFFNLKELIPYLDNLDPTSPDTGRTIVITSYETWRKQSITIDEKKRLDRQTRQKVPKQRRKADYDFADAISHCEYNFQRVILDEGAAAKNPKSRINVAIQHVDSEHCLFLSATALDNSVRDVYGILAILRHYLPDEPSDIGVCLDDYVKFVRRYDRIAKFQDTLLHPSDKWTEEKHTAFFNSKGQNATQRFGLALLHASQVRKVLNDARKQKQNKGKIPVVAAMNVVGTILRILVLKRTKTTKIWNDVTKKLVTPGDDIPKGKWRFIDLANDVVDDDIYQQNFAQLHGFRTVHSLNKTNRDRDEDATNIDGGIERLLVLAAAHLPICTIGRRLELIRYYRRTLDPSLAPITPEIAANSNLDHTLPKNERYPLPHEAYNYRDHFATWFFLIFNTEADPMIPKSRIDMVQALCQHGIKVKFAVRRMLEAFAENERLIIFTIYPALQLLLESISVTLGIPTISMRSSDDQSTRRAKTMEFCKPESPSRLFISVPAVAGQGVNLHKACHRVLIMDLPYNVNGIIQMGGRVERVGQTTSATIEILGTDRTYDIARQGSMADKFVTILASSAKFDADLFADEKMPQERAVRYICEEIARKCLGQSCSRAQWSVDGGKYNKRLTNGSEDPIQSVADKQITKTRVAFAESKLNVEQSLKLAGPGLVVELNAKGLEKIRKAKATRELQKHQKQQEVDAGLADDSDSDYSSSHDSPNDSNSGTPVGDPSLEALDDATLDNTLDSAEANPVPSDDDDDSIPDGLPTIEAQADDVVSPSASPTPPPDGAPLTGVSQVDIVPTVESTGQDKHTKRKATSASSAQPIRKRQKTGNDSSRSSSRKRGVKSYKSAEYVVESDEDDSDKSASDATFSLKAQKLKRKSTAQLLLPHRPSPSPSLAPTRNAVEMSTKGKKIISTAQEADEDDSDKSASDATFPLKAQKLKKRKSTAQLLLPHRPSPSPSLAPTRNAVEMSTKGKKIISTAQEADSADSDEDVLD